MRPQGKNFTVPLMELLGQCATLEELQAKLPEIYTKLGADGALEDDLAAKLFKAMVEGFRQ